MRRITARRRATAWRCGSVAGSVGRIRLSIAAPAAAHAEQLHAVEHGRDGLLRGRACSTTPNRPEAPRKSRFQSAWPGSLGQGRVEHARDLGPLLRASAPASAPVCAGGAPAGRARVRRPRRREVAVVGRGAVAELARSPRCTGSQVASCVRDDAHHQRRNGRRYTWSPPGSRCRRRASSGLKNSGVAQVLSIIDEARRARCAAAAIAGTSCISKVSEPGALDEDQPGVGADQRGDAGADQRVVEGRLDAEARCSVPVAEAARRAVDGVDHQQVVAGPTNASSVAVMAARPEPTAIGPVAALQLRDGLLEREGRRRAEAAVGRSCRSACCAPLPAPSTVGNRMVEAW